MNVVGAPSWTMKSADFDRLIELLVRDFDEVVGPVLVDGVVRMQTIDSAGELPVGVTDDQDAASYRADSAEGTSARRFSYAVGPDSLKAVVHPPRTPVWTMDRSDDGSVSVVLTPNARPERAVVGVRACDLHALARLDRTQLDGPHADPAYAAARSGLFLVAVDCSHPAATCFCASTGTGPTIDDGAADLADLPDLALTEFEVDGAVRYELRAFSGRGRRVADELGLEEVPVGARERASAQHRALRADAHAVVLADLAHAQWADVAERCLTCGNCTAVCPTCFCTDVDDRVELDGRTARRDRVWDTCFSAEYSHLGPGPVRATPASRYRQWLTHKLGTWHDQFGESGCVGCGRCITWCPTGIDLTAEIEALAVEASAGEPVDTGTGGGASE